MVPGVVVPGVVVPGVVVHLVPPHTSPGVVVPGVVVPAAPPPPTIRIGGPKLLNQKCPRISLQKYGHLNLGGHAHAVMSL